MFMQRPWLQYPCSPPTNHFLTTRMSPTKFSKHGDSSFPEPTADVNGNQPSGRARRIILFHRICSPVITTTAGFGCILFGIASSEFTKINFPICFSRKYSHVSLNKYILKFKERIYVLSVVEGVALIAPDTSAKINNDCMLLFYKIHLGM